MVSKPERRRSGFTPSIRKIRSGGNYAAQNRKLRFLPVLSLGSLLIFLLAVYPLAWHEQAEVKAKTLQVVSGGIGVATWLQPYPNWFFPGLIIGSMVVAMGLSVSVTWSLGLASSPAVGRVISGQERLPEGEILLRLFLLESYVSAILLAAYGILGGGLLARFDGPSILGLGLGGHDCAILMLFATGLIGLTKFKGNSIRCAVFPLIAYSIHEALFNAFFLAYNLVLPSLENQTWWLLCIIQISIVTLSLSLRLFRRNKATLIVLASLVGLTLIWMGVGFPVTVNILNPAANTFAQNTNLLANAFEILWNVFCFGFLAVAYDWRASARVSALEA